MQRQAEANTKRSEFTSPVIERLAFR